MMLSGFKSFEVSAHRLFPCSIDVLAPNGLKDLSAQQDAAAEQAG